jgi:Mrp family chromosome partitioning ATPase
MNQATTSPVPLPLPTTLDGVAAAHRRPSIPRRDVREAEESYRKAALFLSKIVAGGTKSILFCSPRRREGTTTAVVSLAHQLRENYGLRPLVIELTRPQPILDKLFALGSAPTIDDAITEVRPAVECVRTTASGIAVIPGGERRGARAHPQFVSGLARVLKQLDHLFDAILIDAPPLLTQADAVIAATIVRNVILVIESGRTTSEVLAQVKGELATEEVRIAGTVLLKHKRAIPRWIDWWFAR